MLDQTPLPTDLHAEQAILGSMMRNARIHRTIGALLGPEHFADPIHGTIFTRLKTLGPGADIRSGFATMGEDLKDVGGLAYLAQLIHALPDTPTVGRARIQAKAVKDHWYRRQVIGAAEQVGDLARKACQTAFARSTGGPDGEQQLASLNAGLRSLLAGLDGSGAAPDGREHREFPS